MDILRLQEELKRARQELLLLYEIGNLIRTSLLLDEVVYLILSAATSHEGFGFNRAILFMVDESGTFLEGLMGIGPASPETSSDTWRTIEEKKITLEGLLDVYHKAGKKIDVELNKIVRQIRLPIEKVYGMLPTTVILDKPALVPFEEARHELCDIHLINLGVGEFATAPLRGKDHVVGVLLVDNVATKKPIREADVRRIMMLANHAGLALENAKVYTEAVIHSQQDSLTKLWNYGHFHKLLDESIREAKTKKQPLSLLVYDVDDFKSYNDSFGHQAGDRALEKLAQSSRIAMRRIDHLARYGGEEFAAILPNTTKEEAAILAQRLRETIEKNADVEDASLLPQSLTVSIGVATFPEDTTEKDKLIFCADGALYDAKRSGKNRVCVYQKPSSKNLQNP